PVRKGDQFIVTGGKYSVEFKIIEIDPAEYCVVVTPTTEIFCEGEHVKRDDKVLESARLLCGDRSAIKQGEGSFTRYGNLRDETPKPYLCINKPLIVMDLPNNGYPGVRKFGRHE
nr:cell division cycle protein 48 homolog [Tanacetum cinerariifolium]